MAEDRVAPRIIIVGAGPAGIRAAETLAQGGFRPIVIDEADRSGGQIYRRQPKNFVRSYKTIYGSEAEKALKLHQDFDGLGAKIDYRPNTQVWALLDKTLHVSHDGSTKTVEFDALILATGATDRIAPLPGWTIPGVYSLGASQIALKAQACAIGQRVAFVGTGPLLYLVSYQYMKVGIKPVALIDTSTFHDHCRGLPWMASRPEQLVKGFKYIWALKRAGVQLFSGSIPQRVLGDGSAGVSGLQFHHRARTVTLDCDAIGIGYHLRSESQLADLAGCQFSFDALSRQWFPSSDEMGRSSVSGIYLAGDGARLSGADGAEVSGKLAALAVLKDLGQRASKVEIGALLKQSRKHACFAKGVQKTFPWPAQHVAAVQDETIICRCEMITAGELRNAAGPMAAPEVNRAKAFSRVGMGRCQGRYCGQASQELVAAARGTSVEAVGRLRGQAPVKPLAISIKKMENDNE